MLVNTLKIPFGVIVELWSACRPRSAPKLPFKVTRDNYKELERPAFGSVRFSLPKASPFAAACYATKYLIKTPNYGFPDWVLDHEGKSGACSQGRVHRFGHSQGFFPKEERNIKDSSEQEEASEASAKKRKGNEYHSPDCICDICLGIKEDPTGTVRMRSLKTIRDRIEDCQQKTASFSVDATIGKDIKPSITNHKYDRTLNVPFERVKSNLESLAEMTGLYFVRLGLTLILCINSICMKRASIKTRKIGGWINGESWKNC